LPLAGSQPAPDAAPPTADRDRRPVDVSSLAGELALNATMVKGDARIAIINNNLYGPGDTVRTSLGSDVTLKIAELELDHVLLVADQGSLRLDYENQAGRDLPAARPAATPDGSGRGTKTQGPISTWLRSLIPRGAALPGPTSLN
jgi:hypothetical protein